MSFKPLGWFLWFFSELHRSETIISVGPHSIELGNNFFQVTNDFHMLLIHDQVCTVEYGKSLLVHTTGYMG